MVKNIYNKIKGILYTDPEKLFEKDKEVLKKSFYFSGTNGKAVLLIHGWTSVPYELRRLGKFLNENGYTVLAPILPGHGTAPEDLENMKWEEWLSCVQKSFSNLSENHEKIYVAGTSLGANLTVMLAKNKPNISGVLLMAMPYKVKFEKLSILFAKILILFNKKYNKKFYPPNFGKTSLVTRMISYQTYPIKSVLELFKLIRISRRVLPKITQPCFVMQSNSDHIVSKNSLEKIYERISSKIKRKKYIERAYHTFISDINNEHVFEDILNFFEEN